MAIGMGLEVVTATVPSGGSLSPAVMLGGKTLVGVAMPAGWDAADLTFQVSIDGGTTWLEFYDPTSSAIDYVVAASRYYYVDPAITAGFNAIKVRSGTASSAVAQSADRVISLILRPVA